MLIKGLEQEYSGVELHIPNRAVGLGNVRPVSAPLHLQEDAVFKCQLTFNKFIFEEKGYVINNLPDAACGYSYL